MGHSMAGGDSELCDLPERGVTAFGVTWLDGVF